VVSALEELPGVKKAFASYPEKKATVSYDKSTVSEEKICQTLLKVGYVANLKTNEKATPIYNSNNPLENAVSIILYCPRMRYRNPVFTRILIN